MSIRTGKRSTYPRVPGHTYQPRFRRGRIFCLSCYLLLAFGLMKQARAHYQVSAIYFVLMPLGVQRRSKKEANTISAIDFGTRSQDLSGTISGPT